MKPVTKLHFQDNFNSDKALANSYLLKETLLLLLSNAYGLE